MEKPGKTTINFACAIASVLALAACGQPEPISSETVAWVNNYYVKHPVSTLNASAGGWLFRGARDQDGELSVGFLVPGPLNVDPEKKKAVMDTLCPAKTEPIWEVLPTRNKLIIKVWTEDQKFKDFNVC
jgi:hypothetical protein